MVLGAPLAWRRGLCLLAAGWTLTAQGSGLGTTGSGPGDGWLILASILLGACVMGVGIRLRTLYLERQQRILNRLVDRRTAELRHALAALERLAGIDPLTEVMNRRRFTEMATAELARAARNDRPVTIALLDLDHFKQINDRHGHQAGDAALVLVARLLSAQCRVSDLVARFGGEEFVLLLPETDRTGAMAVLERIRCAVAGATFQHEGTPVGLTASIGVATQLDVLETLDGLLRRADTALYEAKRAGRNLVACCQMQPVAADVDPDGKTSVANSHLSPPSPGS